jgi:hypothetical protein
MQDEARHKGRRTWWRRPIVVILKLEVLGQAFYVVR